jgi:hypothetical protein
MFNNTYQRGQLQRRKPSELRCRLIVRLKDVHSHVSSINLVLNLDKGHEHDLLLLTS